MSTTNANMMNTTAMMAIVTQIYFADAFLCTIIPVVEGNLIYSLLFWAGGAQSQL